MIKSVGKLFKQDKERYTVPRKVQDVIPVRRIWKDGIFMVGNKFAKTFKFTDINYFVASREDKETMFLTYSELLNSLDHIGEDLLAEARDGLSLVSFALETEEDDEIL